MQPRIVKGMLFLTSKNESSIDDPIRFFYEFCNNDKIYQEGKIKFFEFADEVLKNRHSGSMIVKNIGKGTYYIKSIKKEDTGLRYSFEKDLLNDLNIQMDYSIEFIKEKIKNITQTGHFSKESLLIKNSFLNNIYKNLITIQSQLVKSKIFKYYPSVIFPIEGLINFITTEYNVTNVEKSKKKPVKKRKINPPTKALDGAFINELLDLQNDKGEYVIEVIINEKIVEEKLEQKKALYSFLAGRFQDIKGKINCNLPVEAGAYLIRLISEGSSLNENKIAESNTVLIKNNRFVKSSKNTFAFYDTKYVELKKEIDSLFYLQTT